MVSLDSNMVIPSLIQIPLSFGRPNSEILPMEHQLWSITSLLEDRPNGDSNQESSCHFLTEWMDKDLSTVKAEYKDSYSSLMTTAMCSKLKNSKTKWNLATSKLFAAQQLLTTSTQWEGSSTETIESHWLPLTQRNCSNSKAYYYCNSGKQTNRRHLTLNQLYHCLSRYWSQTWVG